jgi:hypothetical protein
MTRAKTLLRRTVRLVVMVPVAALLCHPSPAGAQSLGAASSFAVLGGSAVTAAAGATIIGDLGVATGTSITGFPPGIVVPPFGIHNNDPAANAARLAADALYTSLSPGSCPTPSNPVLSGATFTPGTYCFSSSALLSSGSPLTLNGGGTYIFQVGSSLTADTNSTVVLNGVNPCNVFWQMGTGSATLNGVNFAGNVVANASITLGSNAILNGRALARAAVTMESANTVVGCGGAPVPTLSQWAMIGLAALLALVGLAAMRRRATA